MSLSGNLRRLGCQPFSIIFEFFLFCRCLIYFL